MSSEVITEELLSDVAAFSRTASALAANVEAFDHSEWDAILKACVVPGAIRGIRTNLFDYTKLAFDQQKNGLWEKFQTYRRKLGGADLKALRANGRLALLFNAYNALCVGHIVDQMRVEAGISEAEGKGEGGEEKGGATDEAKKKSVDMKSGIKSINELSGRKSRAPKVWDQKAGMLCGTEVSLNDIEHTLLRSKWSEPCLHACIVCASVSCPNLRAEAFTAVHVERQMREQITEWLRNSKKGLARKDGGSKAVTVSAIFNWFSGDFKPSVREFINGVAAAANQDANDTEKPTEGSFIPPIENRAKITYFTYDWGLNATHFADEPTSEEAKA
jgi:hypothetical protein